MASLDMNESDNEQCRRITDEICGFNFYDYGDYEDDEFEENNWDDEEEDE